jgi:hypothetical protein
MSIRPLSEGSMVASQVEADKGFEPRKAGSTIRAPQSPPTACPRHPSPLTIRVVALAAAAKDIECHWNDLLRWAMLSSA